MRFRGWISLIAVALLALATAGPHAGAQQGDALQFLQQNPGTPRFFLRSAPPPERARPRSVRPQSYAPRRVPQAAPSELAIPREPEKPPVPPSVFVQVIGDSLGELLAQGLRETMLAERPEISFIKAARVSTGLVRDDYFDWVKAVRDIMAAPDRVDMAVVMLGSNDRQALRDETGSHEFRTERWREVYIRRVDAILATFRERRVPVVWVGMPVMQSPRLSADMLYINELLRERVTRAGQAYVDVWEGFTSDDGQYAAVGPDVSGEMVRLRTADGVHFTRAGARKLGFFASRDMTRLLGPERPPAQLAALPADEPALPRVSVPPPEATPSVPLPEDLPLSPSLTARPLAGPVQPLTQPPRSAGARLASGRPYSPANEATIMREQTLTYGRAPIAKLGRADDFRWPREEPTEPQPAAGTPR
jgi:hypothetical protein